MERKQFNLLMKQIESVFNGQKYDVNAINMIYGLFGRMDYKIFLNICLQLIKSSPYLPKIYDIQTAIEKLAAKLNYLPNGFRYVSVDFKKEIDGRFYDFSKLMIENIKTGKRYDLKKMPLFTVNDLINGKVTARDVQKRSKVNLLPMTQATQQLQLRGAR